MTAYVMLMGLLVILVGVLFVITSSFAKEDINLEDFAAIAILPSESTVPQLRFTLVKGDVPYNLDLTNPTKNDATFVIDGAPCSLEKNHFRVSSGGARWGVGETVYFDVGGSCTGDNIELRKPYSITITLAGKVAYQDTVYASL